MSDENERSVASAGSRPVAWHVTGDGLEYATLLEEHARAIVEEEGGTVAPLYQTVTPLYRSPTLTDAERFVLREVRDIYADEDDVKCSEIAAVIDGLLERTK